MNTAYREFTVADGKTILSSGEARYSFTVKPGRKAVTWANASGGFSPAEAPSIDLHEIAVRTHPTHDWTPLTGIAFDLLSADLPEAWFLSQIEENA